MSRQFFSWVFKTLFKISLLLIAVSLVYGIYLDSKISSQFERNYQKFSIQIYSSPFSISVYKKSSKLQINFYLSQLNYSTQTGALNPGRYSWQGNKLLIFRREFTDSTGYHSAEKYRLYFNKDSLINITHLNQSIPSFNLEPKLVGQLSANRETRLFTPLEDFPTPIADALLAIEDREFYHHSGLSLTAILRAIWVNIQSGSRRQGASTLTQQLAKNMYLSHEKSWIRKFRELCITIILETRYPKDVILEAYLNEVYFAQHGNYAIHGFGLASHFFYNKPLSELRAEEYALLIGLLKGPTYFNPYTHPERAKQRRDTILKVLFSRHLLNRENFQFAINQPLNLRAQHSFQPHRYPSVIQQVKQELIQLNISSQSSLNIYTAFDPFLQQQLEQAVVQQLQTDITSPLQSAALSVDFNQGEIKAAVGSSTPRAWGLNRVTDSKRPLGSLIKPAYFALAFEQGYSLEDIIDDKPITLTTGSQLWTPQNFDKKYVGKISLQEALIYSKNIPAINLGMMLGLDYVIPQLKNMMNVEFIPNYPSVLLGAIDSSVFQVSQLYQVLANQGEFIPLAIIRQINSLDHTTLWKRKIAPIPLIDPAAIATLHQVLHQVTVKGTAKQLNSTMGIYAGKTGTTNDYRDAWFAGFDQRLLTTVWVGNDDNTPINLTGSKIALPIFKQYIETIPHEPLLVN